jgi:DNA adenine methylase
LKSEIAISPIVRWAGSKRKIIERIEPYFPATFDRFVEPFLGSAAVALHVRAPAAVLSDNCKELVETYRAVRDDPDEVIRRLKPLKINEERFYRIRDREKRESDRFKRAAEFIYLNKSCWNGLYRVNKSGKFNVPFGAPKSAFVFNEDDVRRFANYFAKSTISLTSRDFGSTLKWCRKGDFVFLDPPYVTKHNYNGFADWNEDIFSWEDQERLRDEVVRLDKLGAKVMMTNANHSSIRTLYDGFNQYKFSRSSTLASNREYRGDVDELIVTNYEV